MRSLSWFTTRILMLAHDSQIAGRSPYFPDGMNHQADAHEAETANAPGLRGANPSRPW